MKKILVIDPISPFGHADINRVILNIMVKEYDVIYCASEDFGSFVPKNCKYIPLNRKYFQNNRSSIINRIQYMKAIFRICKLVRGIKPDDVLIISYDVVTFGLLYYLFSKSVGGKEKIHLLNHNNIDECDRSKIKRLLFSVISRKSKQVVYEKFIKEYVDNKYGISCDLMRHNINLYKSSVSGDMSEDIQDFLYGQGCTRIIMLSGNELSSEYLDELIELDKSSYFRDRNIKVYLKSKEATYKSQNLVVSGKYLSDREYSALFENSSFILLPYDTENYKYRISGVYYDALTFCKPIIYSNTVFFQDQNNRFGELGLPLKMTFKETLDAYDNTCYEKYVKNIEFARDEYSDSNVLRDIRKLFEMQRHE